jgi:hypothetical protein
MLEVLEFVGIGVLSLGVVENFEDKVVSDSLLEGGEFQFHFLLEKRLVSLYLVGFLLNSLGRRRDN